MSEKPDPNLVKELSQKLQKERKEHAEKLMNGIKESNFKCMRILVDYLKESFKSVGDRDFSVMCDGDDGWYISLDIEKGEDVFFPLMDPNDSSGSGVLIEALLRELLRLWKL